MFYQFCDALEVKDGQSADENGWGLEHAIQGWGAFWNSTYYQHSQSCFRPTNATKLIVTYYGFHCSLW